MRKYYTDTEISSKLKQLKILCDTREQVNEHVTGYFDKNKVPHTTRKLDTGDYSAMIDEYTLESEGCNRKKEFH